MATSRDKSIMINKSPQKPVFNCMMNKKVHVPNKHVTTMHTSIYKNTPTGLLGTCHFLMMLQLFHVLRA